MWVKDFACRYIKYAIFQCDVCIFSKYLTHVSVASLTRSDEFVTRWTIATLTRTSRFSKRTLGMLLDTRVHYFRAQ